MNDPYKTIKGPVITEKATIERMESNKYSFYVHPDSNKRDIKRAVEEIFSVSVEKVHTQRVKGKPKRMGRFEGKTALRKKAMVTLAEGDRISQMEGP